MDLITALRAKFPGDRNGMPLREKFAQGGKIPSREHVQSFRPPSPHETGYEAAQQELLDYHGHYQQRRDEQLRLVCSMRTCAAARDREAGYDTAEGRILREFAAEVASRDPYDI